MRSSRGVVRRAKEELRYCLVVVGVVVRVVVHVVVHVGVHVVRVRVVVQVVAIVVVIVVAGGVLVLAVVPLLSFGY